MSEMRDYMLDFMRSHELSMAKLAELLGYKSKTSLARLMEDSSRPKSVIQFEAAMRRAFTLTEAEDAALHRAVAMTILGRATYLAQEEMWRFVRGESVCDESALTVTDAATGERIDLKKRYSEMTNVQIVLLNCHSVPVFSILRSLLQREDVTVEHFICSDENAAKTLCAINSLMPVFYERRYSGCIHISNPYDDATAPKGVMKADMMAVNYMLPDGGHGEDVIVFNDRIEGTLLAHWGQRGLFTNSLGLKREQYMPLKRTFFQCSAFENYVQFSDDCAQLERNRSMWRIKPDVSVDWIPTPVLLSALKEGVIPPEEQDPQVIDALYQIYDRRVRNTFSKRRPAHTLLKRSAMLRFAQTGRTSDHFWAMRPYTPRERVQILTLVLNQHRSNPYFRIHFLRDDAMFRDAEISLYDDLGILMTKSDTDYDLAAGHSEIMLNHPELMRLFKDFFMKELVKNHTLPDDETSRFLTELIEIAGEQ